MITNSEFCPEYRRLIEQEKEAWNSYEKANKSPSLASAVEDVRRKMRKHLDKCKKCAEVFHRPL